jgi:hypothetical protein
VPPEDEASVLWTLGGLVAMGKRTIEGIRVAGKAVAKIRAKMSSFWTEGDRIIC